MDYCKPDDIEDRLDNAVYRFRYRHYGEPIKKICLLSKTKRDHNIQGWVSIGAVTSLGNEIPLLDIWTGKDGKNKSLILSMLATVLLKCTVDDFGRS